MLIRMLQVDDNLIIPQLQTLSLILLSDRLCWCVKPLGAAWKGRWNNEEASFSEEVN